MLRALKNRLTMRLLIMFFGVLLFLAVTLSVASAILFSRTMDEQVYQARSDTLTQLERNVTTLTNQINSLLQMYEQNLPLQDTLRFQVTPQSLEAFKLVTDLQFRAFEFAMTSMRYGFDIALWGINGVYIQNDKVLFNTDFETVTMLPWYQKLLSGESYAVWLSGEAGLFNGRPPNNYFTVTRLLVNPYTDMVYGVVMMHFREASIGDIFEGLNAHDEITLVNSGGEILASTNPFSAGATFPVASLNIVPGENYARRELDGTTYMAAAREIPRTELTLYLITPESEINAYSRQVVSIVTIIAMVSMLLSVFLVVMFSRSISRPLVDMLQRVRHRRSGPLPATDIEDDLTLLTTEYDVLLEQLESAVSQLEIEQTQKRSMELQMLQYQINPHFLYNTLSSIKCLVWTRRTEMIEPVTDALINLLENTISKNQEMVSLEEELQCVQDYLIIQRIRLDRDIALVVQCVKPALLQTQIPRLLLQPLVENSVFHGIEPTVDGGQIVITVAENQNNVIISIENDGEGIQEETARRILEPEEGISANRRLTRIGVRNVSERVSLYYGGQGSLKIGPRAGGGTAVVLTIPQGGIPCARS